MQGDKFYNMTGKTTGLRVLPQDGEGPKTETSFQSKGMFLGGDATEMATYWSVVRPDGTLYGEGIGVTMGPGGEMATWKAQGVGKFTGPGAASFRGAIYYTTSSPNWMQLNGMTGIFEFDSDAEGNTRAQIWDWK